MEPYITVSVHGKRRGEWLERLDYCAKDGGLNASKLILSSYQGRIRQRKLMAGLPFFYVYTEYHSANSVIHGISLEVSRNSLSGVLIVICPRYRRHLTSIAPAATRLWETFTFSLNLNFRVEAKHEHRRSNFRVSWTRFVDIKLPNNEVIRLDKDLKVLVSTIYTVGSHVI